MSYGSQDELFAWDALPTPKMVCTYDGTYDSCDICQTFIAWNIVAFMMNQLTEPAQFPFRD